MSLNAKKPVLGFAKTGLSISDQRIQAASQDVQTLAHSQQASNEKSAPISWTWRGDNFVKIAGGTYDAICRRWTGPHWIPAYRRYGFRLFFYVLAEDVEVTMFINFGSKPRPPKSVASNYFKAWTMVNGDAPRRDQQMTPDLFLDVGLLYPTTKKDKPPCLVYSRVKEIIRVIRQ
jgi:hypothetical protein